MGHTLPRTAVIPFACPGRRRTLLSNGKLSACRGVYVAHCQRKLAPRAASSDVSAGIFPAGKKQAKVRIPAIHLSLTTDEILHNDIVESVDAYIAAGASALIIRDPSSGGGDLFKAAARLKEVVRGRMPILLEDRTDIVSATQVDGVVLTERGACPSWRWSTRRQRTCQCTPFPV